MKIFSAFLLSFSLTSSLFASVEEVREYVQVSATEAQVLIKSAEGQAAEYNDGAENERFITALTLDKESSLNKVMKELELEYCGEESSGEDRWIDGCGEVTYTDSIVTGFGRGGWMSSAAEYTFFVGFRSDGSGRFFHVTHMVTISESVEAQVTDEGEPSGDMLKYLNLTSIKKLEE